MSLDLTAFSNKACIFFMMGTARACARDDLLEICTPPVNHASFDPSADSEASTPLFGETNNREVS